MHFVTVTGQPKVGDALRREPAVADAQHVRHRLEEGPRVLVPPVGILSQNSRDVGRCKVASLCMSNHDNPFVANSTFILLIFPSIHFPIPYLYFRSHSMQLSSL